MVQRNFFLREAILAERSWPVFGREKRFDGFILIGRDREKSLHLRTGSNFLVLIRDRLLDAPVFLKEKLQKSFLHIFERCDAFAVSANELQIYISMRRCVCPVCPSESKLISCQSQFSSAACQSTCAREELAQFENITKASCICF